MDDARITQAAAEIEAALAKQADAKEGLFDFCTIYGGVRGPLLVLLPEIEKMKPYGPVAAALIRFLMKLADDYCKIG
jgi:hypothetical protein